jgi:hypothetical protein
MKTISTWLRGAGFSAAIAALLVCIASACSSASSSSRTEQPTTRTVTVTETVTNTVRRAPIRETPTYTSLDGSYFSIDYPDDWNVEAAEVSKGSYRDTTIRSYSNPDLMIRVDVSPVAPSDLASSADALESSLAAQPGYQELAFESTTFGGYDAINWEFLVREHGVLLRKQDTFFVDDTGASFAVLTQAPAATYGRWVRAFRHVRGSLFVTSTGSNSSSGDIEASFCETHPCIDNFDEGTGYIVQCADGMWSHSGGRPGACSYHGGESGNAYSGSGSGSNGSGSSGYDLGPGNGSTVTCGDGSISHSGGIQGACSHHGGVR